MYDEINAPDGLQLVFDEKLFQCRYDVSKTIDEHVRSEVLHYWENNFFVRRAYASGLRGATADQKMWAAFVMHANCHSSDHCEQYSRQTDSTAHKSLTKFCAGVVSMFEAEWLRLSNEEELVSLSRDYHYLGFPGYWG